MDESVIMTHKIYAAHIVVKHLDIWLDPKEVEQGREVVTKEVENIAIEAVVFIAVNDVQAYDIALAQVDGYDDKHFDGPGDLFIAKGMGLHQLECINQFGEIFAKPFSSGRPFLSYRATSSYEMVKGDSGFFPSIKEKEDLDVFIHEQRW